MLKTIFETKLKKWKTNCDWAGIRHIKEITSWRSYRDGLPHTNTTEHDEGVLVEVMMDGHSGYCGTTELSHEGLDKAFHDAKNLALKSSPFAIHQFSAENVRPANRGRFSSGHNQSFENLDLKSISQFLKETSHALKVSKKIVSSKSSLLMIEVSHNFYSTSGAHQEQNYILTGTDLHAYAQDGNESQSRSDHGGLAECHQVGLEILNLEQSLIKAKRIGHEAEELLTAPECPTGILDLILMPDQMNLQIHESIGHPLEYDRILGDERNFAGWSFIKPEDFGSYMYGSKLMNVTFDPTVVGEFASYQFDDIGAKATREYLIKDGLLIKGLGSLESQVRIGLSGVANMRTASWNRAPIDRMANINLEAGASSLQSMIQSIENGVLMTANKSWSIDDYRNKFQFGCEYGQQIKNGKIVGVVKNPNYRSKTAEFWKKLAMVGEASTMQAFGTPYCGKGEPSQLIRVGHRSPACLFKDIEIFGGH